ncbi:HesA/MoeB/ThiF family protein [Demequina iriomotensis]|uniref:HesA/MoeB/ThiF family protein n=1 Tax=Demequina iriomotensis TaxID=1536641 RepID=UPI0014704AF2|nr:HesA/MoeB/ThiF family protein [Demequina iriomotensis]
MEADAYVRQRALPGFGAAGQEALSAASVAIVGVGGLGCPAALYLAAAGVGRLTLIDGDRVAVSNLHRQVLFGPSDVGEAKVSAAAARLSALAPGVEVTAVPARLGASSAREALAGHSLVLDCTDTWGSRLAVDDAAAGLGIPLVWGAVQGWFGQVTVFSGGRSVRDVFPEEPAPDFGVCDAGGVLGPLCGQVGAAMASQAVVLLTGAGPGLAGTLQVIDARDGEWRSLPVSGGVRA